MCDEASEIIGAEDPAGVLFNFLGLKYRWGDSIGNLATTIFNRQNRSILPACVLAKGRTAKALEWFHKVGTPFKIFKVDLFDTEEDALNFLHRRLSDETVGTG
jgi:hypothetical protein